MIGDKKGRFRYFALAFGVAFLFLSVVTMFVVLFIKPVSALPRTEYSEPISNYQPNKKDDLTIAVLGNIYRKEPISVFMVLKFDPTKQKVQLLTLPWQTLVTLQDEVCTLRDVFSKSGGSGAKKVLSDTLQIPIDRYVVLDTISFSTAANYIGTVEYEVQNQINFSSSGKNIQLSPGVQLLSGRDVSDMLLYPDYPGGDLEKIKILSDMATEIINQRIDVALSSYSETIFQSIINLVESDVSFADYEQKKEGVKHIARNTIPVVHSIYLLGSMNDQETEFTLSNTTIQEVKKIFE